MLLFDGIMKYNGLNFDNILIYEKIIRWFGAKSETLNGEDHWVLG